MGHKTHPYGFRLGINKKWLSNWFFEKNAPLYVKEDHMIRTLIKQRYYGAGIARVLIERPTEEWVSLVIYTARPGIIIGKGGRKFRKDHRGRMTGKAVAGSEVAFGDYGIQALEPAWITAQQIEACRTIMVRELDKNSKVWIRIFPDKPITKKPAETRMGKGKGDPVGWCAVVKPGRILFEISGVDRAKAEEIQRLVDHKLPIKTRLRERLKLGGER
jgi:large subunit ribosomal protein L16